MSGEMLRPDVAPLTSPDVSRCERLASLAASAGGVLVCVISLLVTVSVIGRWLLNLPVPSDYELVEILTAIAVFAFLGYTQARNGHIAVDTFTLRLPPRVNAVIDGVWDLAYCAVFGFFAWGLFTGGLNAWTNHLTLTQLSWPIWPVYLVCALLAAFTCAIALCVAVLKLRGVR